MNAARALGLGLALAGAAALVPATPRAESPDPEAAIARQVELLERAGWGDPAAFRQAYALTSARHRSLTGPLPRFVHTLRVLYTPLLEPHLGLDFFPIHVAGDVAEQRVTVRLLDGVQYDYVFRVRRRLSAQCPGCWYTDGIYEVEPSSPDGLADGRLS